MKLKNKMSNEIASKGIINKTWLELTDKELEVLKINNACMYGLKQKTI